MYACGRTVISVNGIVRMRQDDVDSSYKRGSCRALAESDQRRRE